MFLPELMAAVTLLALGYLAWRLNRLLRAETSAPGASARRAAASAAGVVRCLHCRQPLRIKLPPQSNLLRCPQCGRQFTIMLWDADNNLYLGPADQDPAEETWAPDASEDNQQVGLLLTTLGLDPARPARDFSLREVRKAYYQAIQRYHPDKYAQLPAEFRRVAERKTRELHLAYHRLMELKQAPAPIRNDPL